MIYTSNVGATLLAQRVGTLLIGAFGSEVYDDNTSFYLNIPDRMGKGYMKNRLSFGSFVRSRLLWLCLASLVLVLVISVMSGLIAYPQATSSQQASPQATHSQQESPPAQGGTLPKPAHIVIAIEENHAYSQIIGSSNAPYINSLAKQGASFTNSHAIMHPSQPNYLALLSGSTQGIIDDSCPHTFSGPDLGRELIDAGLSFAGYSETMPSTGYTDCVSPNFLNPLYARKHNPWVNFSDVGASENLPWTSFPTNYSTLPTISIVIPNQVDDMHSASVQQGDTWLKNNLDRYVQWAKTNNSLFILTWDEDNGTLDNQIPTLFVGSMVKVGQYSENINHYNILRTLEDIYSLPRAHNSANVAPITDCWR